jgi:hypothetical protein
MGQKCSVCRHAKRGEIDEALIGSESTRSIATRFGLAASSIQRHRTNHLRADLVRAHEESAVLRRRTLLESVEAGEDRSEKLYGIAEEILLKALKVRDLRTALASVKVGCEVLREAREYARLRGTATGELDGPESPGGRMVVGRAVIIMPQPKDLEPRCSLGSGEEGTTT